jgi:hypothetical protein
VARWEVRKALTRVAATPVAPACIGDASSQLGSELPDRRSPPSANSPGPRLRRAGFHDALRPAAVTVREPERRWIDEAQSGSQGDK